MNRWLISLIIAVSIAFMTACSGGEDETVSEPAASAEEKQTETANGESDTSPSISLKKFEMEVDYEGTENDFEVSYMEKDTVKALYEDQRNMLLLSGDEAYQEIEPVLSSLDINAETSDEEVIKRVMEDFEVEDGFQSIEIEITHEDGAEKEYEK
ncbi:hypothetical protein E2R51_01145 [Jeotgalibacillus sp. S-D1]|uniref:YusW family protein n=1 Tax=Jeotgalibacillus sp. S-D1 TaxID=2552189 RepID=UPI0010595AA0|nr:YusW family protein [Jeotgalibacillus sp. S-D1]TDL34350.1 hypothetical protein E2R51_01145 [Jeotgalibacillus sp. S-D1]